MFYDVGELCELSKFVYFVDFQEPRRGGILAIRLLSPLRGSAVSGAVHRGLAPTARCCRPYGASAPHAAFGGLRLLHILIVANKLSLCCLSFSLLFSSSLLFFVVDVVFKQIVFFCFSCLPSYLLTPVFYVYCPSSPREEGEGKKRMLLKCYVSAICSC